MEKGLKMKTLKMILAGVILVIIVIIAQMTMLIIDVHLLGIDLRLLQPPWRPAIHYLIPMIMGMVMLEIVIKVFRK